MEWYYTSIINIGRFQVLYSHSDDPDQNNMILLQMLTEKPCHWLWLEEVYGVVKKYHLEKANCFSLKRHYLIDLLWSRLLYRGWDGWMASQTQWTRVWASFGIWWWTGKSGVLQSMESQRVRHSWATELNWNFKTVSSVS